MNIIKEETPEILSSQTNEPDPNMDQKPIIINSNDIDDGFRTPSDLDHKIPYPKLCPPPPRKRRPPPQQHHRRPTGKRTRAPPPILILDDSTEIQSLFFPETMGPIIKKAKLDHHHHHQQS
ncbi:cyclin-dependent protein kinase inhibitor SMR3-like [Impatiens glandulifera]|uniref:cyclin-dependent protein kinase inhibitor SMR3-like n=1 Tax=Impatiens glandulifera TaxID=253017 RepID=UPI001FB08EA7|nr:cyclin-dependent protein kinase inhibitor SMR3-like [Impatiens glandulifera]